MKKLFIIYGVLVSIFLLGCENPQNSQSITQTPSEQVNTQVSTNENESESIEQPERELSEDEDEKEVEEITEELSQEEELKILEENSDYISIIRMSQTGSTGREINVAEDLKGSLRSIVIPHIPNIEPNKDYVVFLMDSPSGEIILTHTERGLIELEGQNDEKLEFLKNYLEPVDENN